MTDPSQDSNETLRVVLADDSVLLRTGIAALLEQAGVEVVGQASDGEDLLRKVRAHKPDVAVVDVRMPPTQTDEGIVAAKTIRAELPGIGILVFSQQVEANLAIDLVQDDPVGVGYLLKDRVTSVDDFVNALHRVADGGSVLDPEVVTNLLGRRNDDDPLAELTKRESEVLQLMAEGYNNQAIAAKLFIGLRSTEQYVTRIFRKLDLDVDTGTHRRVLAVLAYLDNRKP